MTYRSLSLSLASLAPCLLLLACGDDSPIVTSDSSSSSSTGPDPTTTGVDPTTTDSGGLDTSGSESSTTSVAESSTGPTTECGNGVLEDGEVCDGDDLDGETCTSQGFIGGELGCAADCSGFDTRGCNGSVCGNNTAEGSEACDGNDLAGATCASEGFDSGALECQSDCMAFDTSECGACGNVIVDGDEVCDDFLLLGQTCLTQGFDSGALACSADCLAYDTTGCGTCGNLTIDGSELCDGIDVGGTTCADLGMMFDSGTVTCSSDCMTLVTQGCGTCSNGFIDGGEVCDGTLLGGQTCLTQGFDSGALACLPACGGLDTSNCGTCGNGVIDGSESCDGADLAGLSCAGLGLVGGALSCTPGCTLDASGCTLPATPFGSDPFYVGLASTPAVLPCDDISATGTPTGLGNNAHVMVPLGFSFDMYQTPFTQAAVGSNGTIHFGVADTLGLSNSCFPGNTPYVIDDYIIAAFWDDLDPSVAGEVYTQTLGMPGDQRFVVQWDVPNFFGDLVDLMRIQAMLHEDGRIQVCYVDTINAGNSGDSGAQATAGIQRSAAVGLPYSCNTPDLVDGLVLLYAPT